MQGPLPAYSRFLSLTPGVYRLEVVVKDTVTGAIATDDLSLEVK